LHHGRGIDPCQQVIDFLADEISPNTYVNVMEQYRPEYLVARYPEKYPDISRRPSRREILRAYQIARELDLCYEPVS